MNADADSTAVKMPNKVAPTPEPGVVEAALVDLAGPTPAEEIKQRVAWGKGGPQTNPDGTPKMLDYVDARYVQDTLDKIVGPGNWQTNYVDTPGGVRCAIGILVQGVGWVWKQDVGTASNIEPVKGAHSDAFKRAAVQWGIGRDLYSNREDAVDDDAPPAPTATVQQQVSGRAARYGQPADDSEADPSMDENVPECPLHGPMQHKSGVKNSKRWSGYFCTDRNCTTKPVWDPR